MVRVSHTGSFINCSSQFLVLKWKKLVLPSMSFLLFQLKNQRTSGSIRTFCNQKLQEDSQVSIRRWIRRINTGDNQGRALCRSKWDKSKPHRDLLKNPKIKYLVEILKLADHLSNCVCKSVMIIQTANLVQLCTKDWQGTLSERDLLRLELIFQWSRNSRFPYWHFLFCSRLKKRE